ncbi:PWWP domain-containing protein [Mycena sanguinolenta]|uniref:PWWP domain-containing protein n=1 Tax=Mycena sanguinolenta TaxID=230812 RepID=A0A8H7D673_9AGAR|nr:PWWP domain-containing protein [Mycena sanguinolenta]
MHSGKATSTPRTISRKVATDRKDAPQGEGEDAHAQGCVAGERVNKKRKRPVTDVPPKMAQKPDRVPDPDLEFIAQVSRDLFGGVVLSDSTWKRFVEAFERVLGEIKAGYDRLNRDLAKSDQNRQVHARCFRLSGEIMGGRGRGDVSEMGENIEAGSTAEAQAIKTSTESGTRRKRKRGVVTEATSAQSTSTAGGDGKGESGNEKGGESEEHPSKKRKTDVHADKVETDATLTKPQNVANTGMAAAADPEAQKVRKWRQKLQKTFLGNSGYTPQPTAELMPAVDTLFKWLEEYGDMKAEYLKFSKIGKVMRHIHRLDGSKVPRDDEFHFRERAKALVDKWDQILNSNSATIEATDARGGGEVAMGLNGTTMNITMDDG